MTDGDVSRLWNSIQDLNKSTEKIATAVNRSAEFVKQIPDIKKEVGETSKHVERLDERVNGIGQRFDRIEERVHAGHDCYQTNVIGEIKEELKTERLKTEIDVQEGIKTRKAVESLEKNVEEAKEAKEDAAKAKHTSFWAAVGMIVTVVIFAAGIVYAAGRLTQRVEDMADETEEDIERIEDSVAKIHSKVDNKEVVESVDRLQKVVVENGHSRFDHICDGMSNREKRQIQKMFKGRPIPPSCEIQ